MKTGNICASTFLIPQCRRAFKQKPKGRMTKPANCGFRRWLQGGRLSVLVAFSYTNNSSTTPTPTTVSSAMRGTRVSYNFCLVLFLCFHCNDSLDYYHSLSSHPSAIARRGGGTKEEVCLNFEGSFRDCTPTLPNASLKLVEQFFQDPQNRNLVLKGGANPTEQVVATNELYAKWKEQVRSFFALEGAPLGNSKNSLNSNLPYFVTNSLPLLRVLHHRHHMIQ